MLYGPLIRRWCLLWACIPAVALGQVEVSAPIHFGDDNGSITGLGAPTESTSLVSVAYAVSGAAFWATAQLDGDTVNLDLTPEAPSVTVNGLLLRFAAPADLGGMSHAQLGPSGQSLPLLRTDGQPLPSGQVRQGMVCELVLVDGAFIVVAPEKRGCPVGTVNVHDHYCIDATAATSMTFIQGLEYCTERGGRLCTWDEFYIACSGYGAELNGLFTEWEFIDDTANHSQTFGNVGRTTCMSQRSGNAAQVLRTRCCHPLNQP